MEEGRRYTSAPAADFIFIIPATENKASGQNEARTPARSRKFTSECKNLLAEGAQRLMGAVVFDTAACLQQLITARCMSAFVGNDADFFGGGVNETVAEFSITPGGWTEGSRVGSDAS